MSEVSAIRGNRKVTTTFEPSADFPPKKRSGTRAILSGGQLQNKCAVCVAKPGQFQAKCD